MLLAMKSLLSRAALPRTAVASFAPRMSASNESFRRTMPATARAVDVPEAMATATSAARRACTSLAPSPTIATKWPLRREGRRRSGLLRRSDAAKDACCSTADCERFVLQRLEFGAGDHATLKGMPSWAEERGTVRGLSPLMIFGSMPRFSIVANASRTSGRSSSPR